MNKNVERVLEFNKIIGLLAERTTFSLGREKVEKIRPLTNIDRIRKALEETSYAEACILKRGNPPMGGCASLSTVLARLEIGGVLSPAELLKVAGVLRCSRLLKNYYAIESKEEQNIISEYIAGLTTDRHVEDSITNAIIGESEISDFASPELRRIRRAIASTQDGIKSKVNSLVKSTQYKKFLQDSIVTMRGERYVIPVKAEYRSEVSGLVHDASSSGQTLFIEPMAVVEGNNKLKELKVKEEAEIQKILEELSAMCLEIISALETNQRLLAKLDFAFAKGKLSIDLGCFAPSINDEGIINIIKGRHPLIDKKTVVPISFHMGQDFTTVVVTGPNTGGKTVTLKTVGLFTLMMQAGLHVPAAEGTKLAVFKKVFADIGDEQSIEQSLSTFSAHMTNIVKIMNLADDKSLVLMDELGAGTDPVEGAALAMSILEALHQMGALTVATTHYSELKEYALATKGVENASCEFDVETLRPTYKLLIGVPGKSNAFAISEKLGLDKQIILRSKEFLSREKVEFEEMVTELEKNQLTVEREKALAEAYRRESEKLKLELESQKDSLKEKREKMMKAAREEAYEVLEKAKEDAAQILKRLTEIEQKRQDEELRREAEELRLKLKSSTDKLESDLSLKVKKTGRLKAGELQMGDTVFVNTLGKEGVICSLPKNDGKVQVQVGSMKINIDIGNLEKRTKSKKTDHSNRPRNVSSVSMNKAKTATTELKIIGKTVEEGTMLVDKFIDDCAMANLNEVRIVHGKGTGVLRQGVQACLKKNKHVKAFRLGTYGEGEDGVTIVLLK